MHKELRGLKAISKHYVGSTEIYYLEIADSMVYIVSQKESRNLITHPELMGLDVHNSLLPATADFLSFFQKQDRLGNINILNILRGGLNFPIEQSCALLQAAQPTVSFVTSERMTIGENISLQMKYQKLIPITDATIIVGDIIASGSTLRNVIVYMADYYDDCGKMPRNIIVFTIGTFHTLSTIQSLDKFLRQKWPSFEGIIPVFYEGIFNVYDNSGITKLNTVGLDFYLADAFILPQLRFSYFDQPSAIFEKCVIYDGGDRRFNPTAHMNLICNYWHRLLLDESYDVATLLLEKYGHDASVSYNEWLVYTGYDRIDFEANLPEIYDKEMKMIEGIDNSSFRLLCKRRISDLLKYFKEKAMYEYE